MTAGRTDARAVVLAILEQAGAGPGPTAHIEPALEVALDRLVAALGARVGAVYIDDGGSRGLVLRCRRPADPGEDAPPASGIARRRTPGLTAALRSGREVDDQSPAGPELGLIGLDGGLVVPARIGDTTVAALGLAFPPGSRPAGEDRAAVRAVAQILALWVHNGRLIAGLRDRVRELDRQALQLAALTRIARRVAATLDEGEAHRVIVGEARALVRADAAALVAGAGWGDGAVLAHEGALGGAAPPGPAEREALRAAGGAMRDGHRAFVALPGDGGGGGGPLIVVERARGEAFDDDDLERLGGLADQAAVALANARLLSDLRREQDTRRGLAAAIVLAQEDERRRVAEGLHDGPVQELVGVGLMLDALSTQLDEAAPEAAADVNRAAAAAREAVRALRRAIADLHPMSLEELGFAAATRSLVDRLQWRGVDVELDVGAADGLSETHRTVAFRVVQEAVANILNHADPTRVAIIARREGDRVEIAITDDGRGFDPDQPRPGVAEGHLGIAAIEERVALAGGTLTISSAEGRGPPSAWCCPGRASRRGARGRPAGRPRRRSGSRR